MRRECREHFPRHRGLAIPTCITARASRTCRDACRGRWLAVSFEVGGGGNVLGIPGACATRNFTYLLRGPCSEDQHITVLGLVDRISQHSCALNGSFTQEACVWWLWLDKVDGYVCVRSCLCADDWVCIPGGVWGNIWYSRVTGQDSGLMAKMMSWCPVYTVSTTVPRSVYHSMISKEICLEHWKRFRYLWQHRRHYDGLIL